jgi:hypothetical protein
MNKETFLARERLPVCRVPLPNGEELFVRTFTAAERVNTVEPMRSLPDGQFLERMASFSLCDADGTRWFADDQLDALKDYDPTILEAVVYAAQRHNRLTKRDFEELEKNFVTVRTSVSI